MAPRMLALAACALLVACAAAKDIVVGGRDGWTNTVEYLPIEASVGDTLIFNYVPRQHGVALLPTRQAFEKCNKAVAKVLAPPDAVAGAPTGPPFRYTIKQADLDAPGGVLFFGCPVANHCATGQKVEVIVRPMGAMAPAPAPGPAASMTRPLAAAPAAA